MELQPEEQLQQIPIHLWALARLIKKLMKSAKKNKVVLAFSGGLDTSIILKWLQQEYDFEVVTFTADIGQGVEVGDAKKKAKLLGV